MSAPLQFAMHELPRPKAHEIPESSRHPARGKVVVRRHGAAPPQFVPSDSGVARATSDALFPIDGATAAGLPSLLPSPLSTYGVTIGSRQRSTDLRQDFQGASPWLELMRCSPDAHQPLAIGGSRCVWSGFATFLQDP